MNIHDHTPAHSHGRNVDGIDAQRWQAQEAARRGDPAADAGDLRIASSLRHAPPVDLPVDFAVQMAGLAHAQQQASSVLEQRLLRGLVLVYYIEKMKMQKIQCIKSLIISLLQVQKQYKEQKKSIQKCR